MKPAAALGAPRAAVLLAALALGSLGTRPLPEPVACATPRVDTRPDGVTVAICVADRGGEPRDEARGAARLLFGLRLDPRREDPRALAALPGIGPARANAIAREARVRPFCRVEDLERVAGIGPVLRSRVAAFVEIVPGACAE